MSIPAAVVRVGEREQPDKKTLGVKDLRGHKDLRTLAKTLGVRSCNQTFCMIPSDHGETITN